MAQFMNGIKRTNYCGEVTKVNVGQTVVLTGWVAKVRNLGGLAGPGQPGNYCKNRGRCRCDSDPDV